MVDLEKILVNLEKYKGCMGVEFWICLIFCVDGENRKWLLSLGISVSIDGEVRVVKRSKLVWVIGFENGYVVVVMEKEINDNKKMMDVIKINY